MENKQSWLGELLATLRQLASCRSYKSKKIKDGYEFESKGRKIRVIQGDDYNSKKDLKIQRNASGFYIKVDGRNTKMYGDISDLVAKGLGDNDHKHYGF